MQTDRDSETIIIGASGQIGHQINIVKNKVLISTIGSDCYDFSDHHLMMKHVAKDPKPWYNNHGNKRRIYK